MVVKGIHPHEVAARVKEQREREKENERERFCSQSPLRNEHMNATIFAKVYLRTLVKDVFDKITTKNFATPS